MEPHWQREKWHKAEQASDLRTYRLPVRCRCRKQSERYQDVIIREPIEGRPQRTSGSGSLVRARTVSAADISARDVQAWSALEADALEPNAYMSPHFVLPALRHLDPTLRASIVLISRTGVGAEQLAAVAVVCRAAATRLLPVPHLSAYSSRHTYLGTPLLLRQDAASSANGLLDELARHLWSAAGLVLPSIDRDGAVAAAFSEALKARGLSLHSTRVRQRAMLYPRAAGPEAIKLALGKKFNDLERQRRRLSEIGNPEWVIHRHAVGDDVVESFLRLEHAGWKGRDGTSLRSSKADESFFREMVAGFAKHGQAMFTELRLNGQPIASTSNFVSAGQGFAFKLGWDEAYRKYGVGVLNEVELVRQAPVVCADLSSIDSGAAPDSFIESLWPQRRNLATAFLPFSAAGQLAWRAMQGMRSLRAAARKPRSSTRTPPSDTESAARGDT